MKDNVRQELKELCYFIIENNNAMARPEQLTRVQMLYERLLVLNYLEEVAAETSAKTPKQTKPESKTPDVKSTPPRREERPVAQATIAPGLEVEAPAPAVQEETQTESAAAIESETPKEPTQQIEEIESAPESDERRDLNDEHQAPKSVNDQLGKGPIQVGLNDRIAFVQHLFNDSQADFNRVLSQLNTLDTYLESMYFVENLVKPDYDWDDKKAYEDRLINLIKKRFGEDW